jgi:putative endonuclease
VKNAVRRTAPAEAPASRAPLRLADGSRDPRQRLGRLGEAAAEAALERGGLKIVARRFRLRSGEIDLIAERGDLVVFVEVKTRRGSRYGAPAEAVTHVKRERMARAALVFLCRTQWLDRRVRFDVVEVYADGDRILRVRHIADAFRLDRDPY